MLRAWPRPVTLVHESSAFALGLRRVSMSSRDIQFTGHRVRAAPPRSRLAPGATNAGGRPRFVIILGCASICPSCRRATMVGATSRGRYCPASRTRRGRRSKTAGGVPPSNPAILMPIYSPFRCAGIRSVPLANCLLAPRRFFFSSLPMPLLRSLSSVIVPAKNLTVFLYRPAALDPRRDMVRFHLSQLELVPHTIHTCRPGAHKHGASSLC